MKLILHAMHENTLPFINGGEPISWAPDIPIWVSLVVIVGTLAVTTVLSLAADRRRARTPGLSGRAQAFLAGAFCADFRVRRPATWPRPSWPAGSVSLTRGGRPSFCSTSR